jgi:hypothetical protein
MPARRNINDGLPRLVERAEMHILQVHPFPIRLQQKKMNNFAAQAVYAV